MLALALAASLALAAATPVPPAVVVHGGAGGPRVRTDGTSAAAEKALSVLRGGGSALDAVLAAVVQLEDDCRYNAGTGSNIRLDGKTVQMDAAVMDGATGAFGAVAAIERVNAISATGEGGGANWSFEKKAFDASYRQNMPWSVAR